MINLMQPVKWFISELRPISLEVVRVMKLFRAFMRVSSKYAYSTLINVAETMMMYNFAVHDPSAFVLGGVAGHAGLFSTITDVCRVLKTMLLLNCPALMFSLMLW